LSFGPLNKISCFSFEGVFKICKGLFNGTRGINQQIAVNLNISSCIYFNSDNFTQHITNLSLKNFLKTISKSKSKPTTSNSLVVPIDTISDVPRKHLACFKGSDDIKIIRTSLTADINSFGNYLLLISYASYFILII
jgi:hypothetical protein